MTERETSATRRHPGTLISGISLLLAGGWLIAAGAGLPLVGLDRLWPLIVALAGFVMLVENNGQQYTGNGLILWGVITLLVGCFLCLFSFQIGNLAWADLSRYWPVFPLLVGAGFMAVYVRDGMQTQALLIPAHVLGGLGILALPFSLGVFQGTVFNQMLRLWPLLLILIILAVFLRLRVQKRARQQMQMQSASLEEE